MIELELRLVESGAQAPIRRYAGTIRCLRGGSTSDYAVCLYSRTGALAGEATLHRHPRWSESLTALVARSVAAAGPRTSEPMEHVRLATLEVRLRGRYLAEFGVLMNDGRPCTFDGLSTARAAPKSPWQLIGWKLADEAWGQIDVPAMPAPPAVPLHWDGSTPYCRSADLPLDARTEFDRWAFSRSAPHIDGIEDAVFPEDIDAFFGPGTCTGPGKALGDA